MRRDFPPLVCAQRTLSERNPADVRYQLPERLFFQYLGDYADSRWTVRRWALGGLAEFCRQSGRGRGPGTYGLCFGSHRALLLAFCNSNHGRLDRHIVMAVSCRTGAGGNLAKEGPLSRPRASLECAELLSDFSSVAAQAASPAHPSHFRY